LQLDSHTLFQENWDKIIIDLYKEAVLETKNKEKTVLTCYLPEYKHSELQGRIAISQFPKYSFFVNSFVENYSGSTVIAHSAHQVSKIPADLRPVDKFIPSVKFNATLALEQKNLQPMRQSTAITYFGTKSQ
jgi:hypothetical protein